MGSSFYLLDGHAQVFRAYYAPFRDLTSPDGEPTKATYVFCSMLLNLLRERKPDFLAMAMDAEDSTGYRRTLYADYKANREPTPEDLLPQIQRIQEIVSAAGIPILNVPGYEADDVMATLAHDLASETDVYLVSKDKDLEQLVGDHVFLYDPEKDTITDEQGLIERKGYTPAQAVEIQTLTGDSVDNIPGVPGVGIKTAIKLLAQHQTADAVLANADTLTPKLKQNILAFEQQLPITRQLVTLRNDLPIEFDLAKARADRIDLQQLRPVFKSLGFRRLLSLLDNVPDETETPTVQTPVTTRIAGTYTLVDTTEKLQAFIDELAQQPAFAIDTETTGLNAVDAKLVGLAFSWESGTGHYLPISAAMGATLDIDQIVDALKPIIGNPQTVKCGHNIKYDLVVCAEHGLPVIGPFFDTMIASFLLNPTRNSHALDRLTEDVFDHEMIPLRELIGHGRDQTTLDQLDTTRVCEYAAEDADFTWRLYQRLQADLHTSHYEELFADTEMKLIPVLASMERHGVSIDCDFLAAMGRTLTADIESLTGRIYAAAGRSFNIDSPKQLAVVLYEEQGLRVVRKTKTGRSTDAQSLTTLAAESDNVLPALILRYRELSKLMSTYVDSLPNMISRKTGRIHASYNMIGAITGRLSSNDPNLQNIPIRTATGKEIRKAFVAGDDDSCLLMADYSQIELRLLAHYSQDRTLLDAFESNEDVHRFVASQVFDTPLEQVTSEQRSHAKAVNFGIIYGQSAFGLSRTTGMSVSEADGFIALYFLRYPGVRLFIDRCIEQATDTGSATTILGRQRPIPQLGSRNKQTRQLGERLAVNTVLQGSAADLIKQAMIRIHADIEREKLPLRMLIQVHDELVFECQNTEVARCVALVRSHMTTALSLNVPLHVDISSGPNWLEAKHTT